MKHHLLIAAIVLAVTHAAPALAQTPRNATLEVRSLTMSDDALLQGALAEGTPVTLNGLLSLPVADGPVPLVILLHGSAGPGGTQMPTWAKHLNGIGVAAFSLDSYTGRGLEEVFSDQGRLGILSPVYDLYRAVEVLAGHPGIDPDRIAVMGFSRGGVGALYSSMARFKETFGPTRGQLVAHLPFYPPCNFELDRDTELTGAPIRLFHGAADDWNPADSCRTYIDRLAAAGHDAAMIEYPGAHHAFDNPGGPAYFVNGDAETSRNCLRREIEGRLVDGTTGEPFTWQGACVETGPATQYNGPATDAASQAVSDILADVFDLR